MQYRRLGRAGVKVSPICLGAGVRGQLDEQRFVRTIERAIDLGCNFIDCANNYGGQQSEALLGRAIKGKRDSLVITSKVFTPVGPGPNDRGLSRVHIMREVERSLKKLQSDWIDIYYLHNVDPETTSDETLRTFEDLIRHGKVRYVGASNHSATQAIELLWSADRLGLEPIVCLQNHYNLLRRWEVEPELLALCRRYGLGLMTYSPLAIGLLSGRFRRGIPPPAGSYWQPEQLQSALSERADRVIELLADLASARGTTPGQLALAWILDHDEVTAPIIGADRPEYVEELFGALDIALTAQERQALDAASQWEVPGRYL
ncbi:MAG TPA: aldo/keto reductase [Roseiflexaceae bacterium]|nr:aldo/keto reductase [Roseiflexaceae bacterium]